MGTIETVHDRVVGHGKVVSLLFIAPHAGRNMNIERNEGLYDNIDN